MRPYQLHMRHEVKLVDDTILQSVSNRIDHNAQSTKGAQTRHILLNADTNLISQLLKRIKSLRLFSNAVTFLEFSYTFTLLYLDKSFPFTSDLDFISKCLFSNYARISDRDHSRLKPLRVHRDKICKLLFRLVEDTVLVSAKLTQKGYSDQELTNERAEELPCVRNDKYCDKIQPTNVNKQLMNNRGDGICLDSSKRLLESMQKSVSPKRKKKDELLTKHISNRADNVTSGDPKKMDVRENMPSKRKLIRRPSCSSGDSTVSKRSRIRPLASTQEYEALVTQIAEMKGSIASLIEAVSATKLQPEPIKVRSYTPPPKPVASVPYVLELGRPSDPVPSKPSKSQRKKKREPIHDPDPKQAYINYMANFGRSMTVRDFAEAATLPTKSRSGTCQRK